MIKMRNGRPPKSNSELELSGSKNKKESETQIDSEALFLPDIPPSYLNSDAQRHWLILVPPLAAQKIVKEADRMLLGMLCDSHARYYDNTRDAESKRPLIDEKERCKIVKQIVEISDRFGMNPVARARSGVSKKASGVKQRPG